MSNESTGSKQTATSAIEVPNQLRRERSHDAGTVATGGEATIHDRTGLYLAIISFGFSCMAIGAALILPQLYTARAEAEAIRIQGLADRVQGAERTASLAREDVRVIQQALAARGIETDEHAQEIKK